MAHIIGDFTDCFAWRQAAHQSPLFQSAVSHNRRILFQFIVVNITILLDIFKGAGKF